MDSGTPDGAPATPPPTEPPVPPTALPPVLPPPAEEPGQKPAQKPAEKPAEKPPRQRVVTVLAVEDCGGAPSIEPDAPADAAEAADAPPSPRLARRLRWMKVGMFALFFGHVVPGAFISVLLQAKGFSPSAIGLIAAFPPVATLTTVPLVSLLAETSGRQRTWIFGCTAGGFFSLTGLCLTQAHTDAGAAVAVAFAAAFFGLAMPALPLFDEHSMAVLGPTRRAQWGEYRAFGGYGWAIGAPIASAIFGAVGWQYSSWFWAAGMLAFVAAVHGTPVPKTASDHNARDVAAFLLCRPRLMVFLLALVAMGVGYAVVATFLFLFLNELGAPPVLLGLCLVATVVVEVPLFQRSAALHDAFSNRQLLLTAMAAWVVRAVGYSLLPSPWLVLLLEPLHGATFGLMWLAGVNQFANAFPPALANSAFGVLHAAAFGAGPLIGNVAGGFVYEAVGPRTMFRLFSVAMAVAAAAFLFTDQALERSAADDAAADGFAQLSRPAPTPPLGTAPVEGRRHGEVTDELPADQLLTHR